MNEINKKNGKYYCKLKTEFENGIIIYNGRQSNNERNM